MAGGGEGKREVEGEENVEAHSCRIDIRAVFSGDEHPRFQTGSSLLPVFRHGATWPLGVHVIEIRPKAIGKKTRKREKINGKRLEEGKKKIKTNVNSNVLEEKKSRTPSCV